GVTYPNSRVVTYAYDAAGNRTQVTDNGVSAAYAANTLNQYSSAGAAVFGYDLDGNLTNRTESATNTIYTYDSENRLIGVATPADIWTYTYDAFGNRIAAAHNGQTTRYVIDPTRLGNVAAEYDGGGSLIARYEHGFGLLARSDAAGSPAYYTFSAIGHTTELTDPSGAVANAYAYDPFGLSLAKTETIPNPFEFVGEFGVMNEGNGLEFMRARFHVPKTGRFLQPDPNNIGGGLNMYTYARNNPSMYVDVLGAKPKQEQWWVQKDPPYPLERETTGRNDPVLDVIKIGKGIWDVYDIIKDWRKIFEPFDPIDYLIDPPPLAEEDYTWDPKHKLFTNGDDILPIDPFDIDPMYQHDRQNSQIFRSRDPNDKLGPSGYGSAAYLPADGTLAYQIRFENQSSATAPAERVTVSDSLDPNLDLSTFELTEIAFANQVLAVPAGLNHYEKRLAFTVTNQTLIPLGDATAFALTPPSTNAILVEVDANLDVPTRQLTLTLTTLDPLTDWYPENPLLGFLYPNDAAGRGDGSISYLVRPQANLTTGATITNRASIVFDYNDPIITPLVLNTIDSGAPNSAVSALPAEAGPVILVQWSGQDDSSGSGLATFDVYATENGTNEFRWLENTTATSAWFPGVLGSTYAFYSIARDNVGNAESRPAALDAITFVPTNAPVLNLISNHFANVGDVLAITNMVTGTPIGSYLFTLGAPAPFGAAINRTNGILRWTPNCAQASRTHLITVWVTDTGNSYLRDAKTFEVTTRECLVPQLGRLVLRAGDSGRIPVNLISSVALTGLTMTIEAPPDRVTLLSLESIVPEICGSSILALSNDLQQLTFTTCSNQFLTGTQQIAWLYFSTVTAQSSAFVKLALDNIVGLQPDGTAARNFAAQSGRLVIIAHEPLLESSLSLTGQRNLILYAPHGSTNIIESTLSLANPIDWQPAWEWTMTNLFQFFEDIGAHQQSIFYRTKTK
ncbi:MAG TPA: RHS repeat-associated core domain-containing protein, partial [Verrucomicrobiae bacterium]|nr:RHS repeat-associated core domain-containing protein [Verrucomicrobiae bacterium]